MRLLTTPTTPNNIHHHRNLKEYVTEAPAPNYPPFRLANNDNGNGNDSIATTDMNMNTNSNERIMSPRNSSNIINTLTTDTNDDTTAINPITNTTVRPIANTSIILTGSTMITTTTRPTVCDWLDDIDTHNTIVVFQCGKKKCAYHSISSRRRDRSGGNGDNNNSSFTRYGYLVSSDEGNQTFHKPQQGFGFAQHLTKKFAIRHTLLEPPRRTDLLYADDDCLDQQPIDQDFMDRLNGARGTNRNLKKIPTTPSSRLPTHRTVTGRLDSLQM